MVAACILHNIYIIQSNLSEDVLIALNEHGVIPEENDRNALLENDGRSQEKIINITLYVIYI